MPNILSRQQKAFKFNSVMPIDANNLDVDEAVSRFFVYLRTSGRLITKTSKPVFTGDVPGVETPVAVVNAVLSEPRSQLSGMSEQGRRELLTAWLETHFALMSRRGKTKGGDYRMSGLRPLHFSVIKLFNPKVNRQDRYLADFFYNALADDEILYSRPDSLMKQFFAVGVRPHGDTDYKVDEAVLADLARENRLDIELLFLLRLTELFEVDKFSTKKDDVVPSITFLCPEQIGLLRQDLKLLFLYKGHIPRRELINYMTTLMVFHAALYLFQVVRITNDTVAKGALPAARGGAPSVGEGRTNAPFDLNLFCDLTNGHDATVKAAAERCYASLFKEFETYFRSGYIMKKLEEFASSYLVDDQKKLRGRAQVELLLGFRKHPALDGHFSRDVLDVVTNSRDSGDDDEPKENNDVQRLVDICNKRGLDRLETFVELLVHFQYSTLREQHRKLIASLCGVDQEQGFLAGKGRAKRRFVLGNELLEVLIQLAVLRQRASDGRFETRPIEIRRFVDWMAGRYGLLVDRLAVQGAPPEEEHLNRAFAVNSEALKTRLRQLGFFSDLADAGNSQVIAPRFTITDGEIPASTTAT